MAAMMKRVIENPLIAFFIASADMTYNEIAEREVYLLGDPQLGYALRGEIAGCGEGCYTDLNQILLEYALSCEGCIDQQSAEASIAKFGRRLGLLLAGHLPLDNAALADFERLSRAFACVLDSMSVPYEMAHSPERLKYTLDYCPLCEAGQITGLSRELTLARYGFAELCRSLVSALAPGWSVLRPLPQESDQDLLEVTLIRG